jgi:peptidoglycan hydrolase-like protein with peptidoglycan-binding domain
MRMMKKIVLPALLIIVFCSFGLIVRAELTVTQISSPQIAMYGQGFQLTRQLELGTSGDDVKNIQFLLATWPDIYPEQLTTGFYGALTQKAVAKFQEKNGLEAVGRIGPLTLKKLNDFFSQNSVPVISSVNALPINTDTTRINWTTNLPATTRIFYGTSASSIINGPSWTVNDKTLLKNHTIDLTHLVPGTMYYYAVWSENSLGAVASTSILSFTK